MVVLTRALKKTTRKEELSRSVLATSGFPVSEPLTELDIISAFGDCKVAQRVIGDPNIAYKVFRENASYSLVSEAYFQAYCDYNVISSGEDLYNTPSTELCWRYLREKVRALLDNGHTLSQEYYDVIFGEPDDVEPDPEDGEESDEEKDDDDIISSMIVYHDRTEHYNKDGYCTHRRWNNGFAQWWEFDGERLVKYSDSEGREDNYDEKGNLVRSVETGWLTTFMDYDDDGNMIHFKDSEGFEYHNEYENGKLKRCIDNRGCEQIYDDNGNMIHYKDASGREYFQEFDDDENKVLYRDKNMTTQFYYSDDGTLQHSKTKYVDGRLVEKWFEGHMVVYEETRYGEHGNEVFIK